MDKIYSLLDDVSTSEKIEMNETNSFSGILFSKVISAQNTFNIKHAYFVMFSKNYVRLFYNIR